MRDTNKLYELTIALETVVSAHIIAPEYAKSILNKYLIDEGFIQKKVVEEVRTKPEVK